MWELASIADDVLSGTTGPDVAAVPDRAVLGRDEAAGSPSKRAKLCISVLSGAASPTPPAAAIICGLRGLDVELARLPFRECCIP